MAEFVAHVRRKLRSLRLGGTLRRLRGLLQI
jgi:hypothetical protein